MAPAAEIKPEIELIDLTDESPSNSPDVGSLFAVGEPLPGRTKDEHLQRAIKALTNLLKLPLKGKVTLSDTHKKNRIEVPEIINLVEDEVPESTSNTELDKTEQVGTSVELVTLEEKIPNELKSVLESAPQHFLDYLQRSGRPVGNQSGSTQKMKKEVPVLHKSDQNNNRSLEEHVPLRQHNWSPLQAEGPDPVAEENRYNFLQRMIEAVEREEIAHHLKEVRIKINNETLAKKDATDIFFNSY